MGMFGADELDVDNPAEMALPYLREIPGAVQPYYQPYIDWGMDAGNTMAQQYGQMSNDPQGYYNNIMQGYTQSPGYQYQSDQLQQQMSGDAAAGGFTGTGYDQQRQGEAIQGMMGKDQQQYFNNVSGSQQAGLKGESDMFGTGYQASNSMADMMGSSLAAQAGLMYKGSSYQNQKDFDNDQNRQATNRNHAKMAAEVMAMIVGK